MHNLTYFLVTLTFHFFLEFGLCPLDFKNFISSFLQLKTHSFLENLDSTCFMPVTPTTLLFLNAKHAHKRFFLPWFMMNLKWGWDLMPDPGNDF